ncbi:glycosyltransferase family 2 protein [Burkholderia vietnamiensis]|uniref:glycosyltransferase family 2 protein n=1 Tax=Burkholderia vietnamiensis TaxID=60552 RepID=UPI00158AE27D|nr:glycosyltransferase family 2 protein [Burkholderia vietnamiensis]MBR8279953.1 glycosyltransferase family 2 protein [Burkholderia vietnamiensis]WHU91111.1 glycosyltransferase family 2 protein [Burkholderia vietnamiensis]HDR9000037.1 glycosyltransferase family 2 protein [Burkholderia vietnamiensis]HDR9031730.1 glycosyltransferase family 2 protein [Burkholderia vietnamiensis]
MNTSRVPLTVSIVVYRPDVERFFKTLYSLRDAVRAVRFYDPNFHAVIWLVDNGCMPAIPEDAAGSHGAGFECASLSGHGNVGYGRGHNVAIALASSEHHLILNPDIDLDENALVHALGFMRRRPDVGLLTPNISDEKGNIQYLCRRSPTMLDLLVRGFFPASWKARFMKRLARYEMRDVLNDHDIVEDPPIVSGCFMLFRTEVLKKLGGFDPRYFLYFEDYDLSLRTHDVARVAYVPSVRVIHHGGGASRKGFAHIRMFAASAFKFYNRFGWRLW